MWLYKTEDVSTLKKKAKGDITLKEKQMDIGYARVSTQEQNLDLQLDELKKAGVDKIFQEKVSGGKWEAERPELDKALNFVREGDKLIIWKLDRLGRSLPQLIRTVNQLKDKNVELKSLKENIDTSSATGKLMFHIFGSLAEFERDMIKERVKAGLISARERGRLGGRPTAIKDDKEKLFLELVKDATMTTIEKCRRLEISRMTYWRIAKKIKSVEEGS